MAICRLIICTFILFFSFSVNGQVQQGIVKTRGRMVNGVLVPGHGIGGVIVQIKGRLPVITAEDGGFAFFISSALENNYIVSVKKSGYELVDMEALQKPIRYTQQPIVIVIETKEQIISDRLAVERNIRRSLQRQLQKREYEIEERLANKEISQEEYRHQLHELYNKQEANEKLIEDMARRYSSMDYDMMSENERKVSDYILSGELSKADSILTIRGEVTQRVTQLRQQTTDPNLQIEKIRQQIEYIKLETNKEKQRLADDCYAYAEIFKTKVQYDSVAYYLDLRCSLDTTNIQWNLDAGNFIVTHIHEKKYEDRAMNYFRTALITALSNTKDSLGAASSYHSMGDLLYEQGNYKESLNHYLKELEICNYVLGDTLPRYAQCVERIAIVYNSMKSYEQSIRYHLRALDVFEKYYGLTNENTAKCYNNLGVVYENLGKYEESIECYNKSIKSWRLLYGDAGSADLAICYNNLGGVFDKTNNTSKSINYYKISIKTYNKVYGADSDRQLGVACVYNNMGTTYFNASDYSNALTNLTKALKIIRKRRELNHPDVRTIQNNITMIIEEMAK